MMSVLLVFHYIVTMPVDAANRVGSRFFCYLARTPIIEAYKVGSPDGQQASSGDGFSSIVDHDGVGLLEVLVELHIAAAFPARAM